jgi:molybdenum cofactor synthesis domain-containing protein
MIRVAILTLSDRASRGEREDRSGPAIEKMIKKIDAQIASSEIIPDDKVKIRSRLVSLCKKADLILTTGGTGVSPRDVTPDVTRAVIKQELPGITEAMRLKGLKKTPFAMISRAVAGVRDRSLIINLPGSPTAVKENLSVILPVLPHTIDKIKGDTADCASLKSGKGLARHGKGKRQ